MSRPGNRILTSLGPVDFRPVNTGTNEQTSEDILLLHRWLTHPRSHFWEALGSTPESVSAEYTRIAISTDEDAWILELRGEPKALVETYDPAFSPLVEQLTILPGDRGMHILIAPPDGEPVAGLTDCLFAAVLRWMFEIYGAQRIVVEPDVHNHPIHVKNRAGGFRDVVGLTDVVLGNKHARIQECSQDDFIGSALAGMATAGTSVCSVDHLRSHGVEANRQLLAKALREFAHERLIEVEDAGTGRFYTELGGRRITFHARKHGLEHLSIDPGSLRVDGGTTTLVDIIGDAAEELGIPDEFVHTYLEEVAATVAARARVLALTRPTSAELASNSPSIDVPEESVQSLPHRVARFQRIESAMFEGHPGFLANAGRNGMGETHTRSWAPETGAVTRLVWLAALRERCVMAASRGVERADFEHKQLSPALRERFHSVLVDRNLDPDDYAPLPVHPWQWEQIVTSTFSGDLIDEGLVLIGQDDELVRPQQSLRTFFPVNRPETCYTKTAVAVRNMGFLRGLSPGYMETIPAINDWLADVLADDPEFGGANVRLLREVATIGYTGDVYHRSVQERPSRASANTKMLSALWRESPIPMLTEGSTPVTLAGVLYLDPQGVPLVGEWIRQSGVSAVEWVQTLLTVYFRPLIHALVEHAVVFMPHTENVILELRHGLPVGAFHKDLGEEVALVSPTAPLPTEVERIRADHGDMDDAMRALSLHTDVLDGVLRHLAAILDDHHLLPETRFWQLCRECVAGYRADHPETADRSPLDASSFRHSCLNRLQLRNPETMVDLGNQNTSLMYAGWMDNPLASG